MPEKEHTSTIGSSLGGQASLHLLLRFPDLFGKAACLSPAFQPSIISSIATQPSEAFEGKTIYIDNGGDENESRVALFDPFDHLSSSNAWNPGYWWLDTQLQPSIGESSKTSFSYKSVSLYKTPHFSLSSSRRYETCHGFKRNSI